MSQFGCIKDRFDDRDYLMRAYLPVVKLPKKVDYTQKMSPIRDQGDEGVCVGFAVASGMKEYQEFLDYQKLVLLSPRFVYSEAKKIDGMPGLEGTTIRASMQVLKKIGVCQEKFWPYSPHQKDKPREGVKANAQKFCIITYARILNLNELRLSLFSKGPCVLGIEVFEGMLKTKTGIVPMPKKNETSLGGHAIATCGYDDEEELVKFKNSWGCYDAKTEILTSSGWKLFKDVKEGESIATLNPVTHYLEYQPIIQKFIYDYDGYLWRYKGRDIDLLVTPNHKLFIKSIKGDYLLIEANKLRIKIFSMKKDARWKGLEIKDIIVGTDRIKMDLWLEFLGYFLSEGHTSYNGSWRKERVRKRGYFIKGEQLRDKKTGRFIESLKEKVIKKIYFQREKPYRQFNYTVGISQKEKNTTMENCLKKLPWKFTFHNSTWTTNNKDLYLELKKFEKSPQKFIPQEIKNLSPRQLKILFNALMLGDGSGKPRKKWTYYTSSKQLADDVQEILLKIGWAGDISFADRRGRSAPHGITRYREYRVGIKTKELEPTKGNGFKPDFIPYKEKIYCVTVPNHIVFVRRNGRAVWSGNSQWGDKGYGYLPYTYIERYMMDAWSSVDIEDPNPLTLASVLMVRHRSPSILSEVEGLSYRERVLV